MQDNNKLDRFFPTA